MQLKGPIPVCLWAWPQTAHPRTSTYKIISVSLEVICCEKYKLSLRMDSGIRHTSFPAAAFSKQILFETSRPSFLILFRRRWLTNTNKRRCSNVARAPTPKLPFLDGGQDTCISSLHCCCVLPPSLHIDPWGNQWPIAKRQHSWPFYPGALLVEFETQRLTFSGTSAFLLVLLILTQISPATGLGGMYRTAAPPRNFKSVGIGDQVSQARLPTEWFI